MDPQVQAQQNNTEERDDLQFAQEKLSEFYSKYNESLSKSMNGLQISDEEKELFTQAAASIDHTEDPLMKELKDLLSEIGYDDEQVEYAIDELRAITAIRIHMKVLQNIPQEKRDSIEKLMQSEEWSPLQINAMVDAVYFNATGKNLTQEAEELFADTVKAYIADLRNMWNQILAARQ